MLTICRSCGLFILFGFYKHMVDILIFLYVGGEKNVIPVVHCWRLGIWPKREPWQRSALSGCRCRAIKSKLAHKCNSGSSHRSLVNAVSFFVMIACTNSLQRDSRQSPGTRRDWRLDFSFSYHLRLATALTKWPIAICQLSRSGQDGARAVSSSARCLPSALRTLTAMQIHRNCICMRSIRAITPPRPPFFLQL